MKKLQKDLGRLPQFYLKAAEGRMDYELRKTVNHIKVEYSRPTTGKGFTDRTGNLRNSTGYEVERTDKDVTGWVNATMDYAEAVEVKYSGRFAFLWPGVNDKKQDILDGVEQSMDDALRRLR